MTTNFTLLACRLLERLTEEWNRNYLPEEVPEHHEMLECFFHVSEVLDEGDLAVDELYAEAPAFSNLYRCVLGRDIDVRHFATKPDTQR